MPAVHGMLGILGSALAVGRQVRLRMSLLTWISLDAAVLQAILLRSRHLVAVERWPRAMELSCGW